MKLSRSIIINFYNKESNTDNEYKFIN